MKNIINLIVFFTLVITFYLTYILLFSYSYKLFKIKTSSTPTFTINI